MSKSDQEKDKQIHCNCWMFWCRREWICPNQTKPNQTKLSGIQNEMNRTPNQMQTKWKTSTSKSIYVRQEKWAKAEKWENFAAIFIDQWPLYSKCRKCVWSTSSSIHTRSKSWCVLVFRPKVEWNRNCYAMVILLHRFGAILLVYFMCARYPNLLSELVYEDLFNTFEYIIKWLRNFAR